MKIRMTQGIYYTWKFPKFFSCQHSCMWYLHTFFSTIPDVRWSWTFIVDTIASKIFLLTNKKVLSTSKRICQICSLTEVIHKNTWCGFKKPKLLLYNQLLHNTYLYHHVISEHVDYTDFYFEQQCNGTCNDNNIALKHTSSLNSCATLRSAFLIANIPRIQSCSGELLCSVLMGPLLCPASKVCKWQLILGRKT